MTATIYVTAHGQQEDDLRAAFGELVRSLRAATPDEVGAFVAANLATGTGATYTALDIPDEQPADDEEDGDPL